MRRVKGIGVKTYNQVDSIQVGQVTFWRSLTQYRRLYIAHTYTHTYIHSYYNHLQYPCCVPTEQKEFYSLGFEGHQIFLIRKKA